MYKDYRDAEYFVDEFVESHMDSDTFKKDLTEYIYSLKKELREKNNLIEDLIKNNIKLETQIEDLNNELNHKHECRCKH